MDRRPANRDWDMAALPSVATRGPLNGNGSVADLASTQSRTLTPVTRSDRSVDMRCATSVAERTMIMCSVRSSAENKRLSAGAVGDRPDRTAPRLRPWSCRYGRIDRMLKTGGLGPGGCERGLRCNASGLSGRGRSGAPSVLSHAVRQTGVGVLRLPTSSRASMSFAKGLSGWAKLGRDRLSNSTDRSLAGTRLWRLPVLRLLAEGRRDIAPNPKCLCDLAALDLWCC